MIWYLISQIDDMDDDQQFTLQGNALVNRQGIPRRDIFRLMSREERQLKELLDRVDHMGKHPELMSVAYLLRRAKDRLGDYLDRNTEIIND